MGLKRSVLEVVNEVILTTGLEQTQRVRLLSHAFSFIRELSLYNGGLPTTVKEQFYPVPATKIIMLPDDFVNLVALYTQIGKNKKILSENTLMSSFPETSEVPPNPNPDVLAWWSYGNVPFYGYGMGDNQGQDKNWGNGRYYGDFKLDLANKRIELNERFRGTNVIVEYVSNCVEQAKDLCLLPQWQTPMQHYILWKHYAARRMNGDADYQYSLYEREMRLARQTLQLKLQDLERIVEQVLGYRYT